MQVLDPPNYNTPDYHPGIPEASPKYDPSLSPQKQAQVKNTLSEFPTVATHTISRTTLVTHKIATTELVPIRRRAYPCLAARRATVQADLQFLSEQGFIVPSDAPWAAPLFTVHKKNGQILLVVDYSQLNNVSVSDPYVFPRIEEIIESMAPSSIFSTLDLAKGYYQVLVYPDSQGKTSFTVREIKFRVMPFWLKNAPATFQRLMDIVLKGTTDFCRWYIDISIFSLTWDTHIEHLHTVVIRLQSSGLTLQLPKCLFGAKTCEFLRHKIGPGYILPQQAKVDSVANFVTPV